MRRVVGERECFVPEAGNVFMASDYDSFELCTLAQCCLWMVGFSRLAEVLREGRDPHLAFGAQMLGLSYEDALTIYKNPKHPRRAEVKRARQGSKIADFGYPGGMSAQSFRDYARGYKLFLSYDEAEELLEGWHVNWPEMEHYFRWIKNLRWRDGRRKDRLVQVTDIVQFASERKRANITYTVTCNTYFQGLASDGAKDAAFQLVQAVELGSLRGWKVWNFIHDEFLLEGPEEDAHRAALEVQRIMCEAAQKWVPDIPIKASPALMRRWHKAAEPVYENGILVPWEPEK
jgi:DNA polymerase-1